MEDTTRDISTLPEFSEKAKACPRYFFYGNYVLNPCKLCGELHTSITSDKDLVLATKTESC